MNTKDLNPIVNIGTAKDPLMVLCATTMMMLYQADTGKKYDPDNVDDYMQYVDDYRDTYNANLDNKFAPFLTKVYAG